MIIPESIAIDPRDHDIEERIAALPAGSGVYAIFIEQAATPHLSACAYLRARIRRMLGDSAAASKQRLREQVERIECWPTASRLETWLLLLGLGQRWFPREYERRLRLRRPWFVTLSADRFPKLLVLNRLPEPEERGYGPFPSRDTAAAYAEAIGGLFQIRKCPDPLEPAADHPGCIYGEMHQCLRPCQCVVTIEEYASEAARVDEFLRTNGNATRTSLMMARERASEDLDFEAAAQLHKRLERVAGASALREEPASLLQHFGGVAVTPSLDEDSVRLWPMRDGMWLTALDVPLHAEDARSLDARVKELLSVSADEHTAGTCDRSAHLAILLRWYRSSYRDGEWVQDVPGKGISYRKVVGAISRLRKPGAIA